MAQQGEDAANYIFKSARLGFRNWTLADVPKLAEINADPDVMEFFPNVLSEIQTSAFIERMQKQYEETGFCYFAVDKLENGAFIGFIGISKQTYEADFTPCVDIGWRIDKREWNKGYATEGAKRCLEFAFEKIKLETLYSVAPVINVKSEQVMKKIGMQKVKHFNHPLLNNDKGLQECVLYKITNE